jgi:hypothetical protein
MERHCRRNQQRGVDPLRVSWRRVHLRRRRRCRQSLRGWPLRRSRVVCAAAMCAPSARHARPQPEPVNGLRPFPPRSPSAPASPLFFSVATFSPVRSHQSFSPRGSSERSTSVSTPSPARFASPARRFSSTSTSASTHSTVPSHRSSSCSRGSSTWT